MSTSYIFWWPRGASSFQTIALPRTSDLILSDKRSRTDAFPIGGSLLTADLGGWRDVRIISERIPKSSDALIRQLRSLDTHMRAGGSIAFSLSIDGATGAWARAGTTSGAKSITLKALSEFPYGGLDFAVDDLVTIESPNPNHFREYGKIAAVSGNVITLEDGLLHSMDGPVFIRKNDFYPVLFMEAAQAQSAQWLTHDHRRNWTVDLTVVEMPGSIQALAPVIDLIWSDSAPEGIGHLTPDQAFGWARVNGPRITGTSLGDLGPTNAHEADAREIIGLG